MAAYSELLPDILPHVASCPVPSITRALQIVAQDFFSRSEAYRYDIAPTSVAPGESQVTVAIPANTRIVCPLTMYLDGERMSTATEDLMALKYGDWRSMSGRPNFIFSDDKNGDQLVVALPADGNYSLTGRVSIKPTRSATELDDDYLEMYGDALVDGVLHRLMMMANTEWHNPKLAAYYQGEYERAIDEAHNVSNKGNTSRLMTTGYGGI